MKVPSTADQNELAELSKLVHKCKTNGIRAYNMAMIEETLEIGGSLKTTTRELAIGKDRMYALKHEKGNITHSIDEIIKVPERFYTRLYASDVIHGENTERTSLACDVPLVTKEEVGSAFKGMKTGQVAGDYSINVDL